MSRAGHPVTDAAAKMTRSYGDRPEVVESAVVFYDATLALIDARAPIPESTATLYALGCLALVDDLGPWRVRSAIRDHTDRDHAAKLTAERFGQ